MPVQSLSNKTAILPTVVAVQDLDCIDRAKFKYILSIPTPPVFLEQFDDSKLVIRAFSKFTPHARDLFSITKPDCFRCDGIVGGQELFVSFAGDPLSWPLVLMEDFARRLRTAGFATPDYVRGNDIDCAICPARLVKKCRGATLGEGFADPASVQRHQTG